MNRLPDGSGFFVQTIGARPPGFIYWLKARPNGSARAWYFFWLNYGTWLEFGRTPADGPISARLKALRWAWTVS